MLSTYMAASWLLQRNPKKSKHIDKTFSAGKLFAFHFVALINALAAYENTRGLMDSFASQTIFVTWFFFCQTALTTERILEAFSPRDSFFLSNPCLY